MRLLRKRGLLPDDEDPPDDDLDPSPLKQLAAAAVQGKLALGPDAGAPTPRIGRRRETIAPRTKKRLCAECEGLPRPDLRCLLRRQPS